LSEHSIGLPQTRRAHRAISSIHRSRGAGALGCFNVPDQTNLSGNAGLQAGVYDELPLRRQHDAHPLAKPGDVLVVSACDHPEQGGFGEMLATARVAKMLAGLVTDAGVRDGPAIRNTPAFISSLMGCA